MKHLKTFESIINDINDEEYNVNVGDTLYCINNKGVEQDLELGRAYTVDKVYDNEFNTMLIFRLKETESRWMRYRFSPDPNHINILNLSANKYNI